MPKGRIFIVMPAINIPGSATVIKKPGEKQDVEIIPGYILNRNRQFFDVEYTIDIRRELFRS